MNYKLYTDKPNKFSCNIQVDGTSLANSKVRLVIESDDFSYLFNGVIYDTGVCEVNIPKTKNFLSENKKGSMRLEVIADDVFFEPWNSDFVVETSKKVAVMVQEQEEVKPSVKVQLINQQPTKPVVEKKIINQPIVEKKVITKQPVKDPNELSKKELLDLLSKKR